MISFICYTHTHTLTGSSRRYREWCDINHSLAHAERRFGCDNFYTFHTTRCVARSFQSIRFQNGLALHLFFFFYYRVCGRNEWACSYREIATTFDKEHTLREHLHIYRYTQERERGEGLLQFYRRIIQAISRLGTEETSFDTYDVHELV